MQHVWLLKYPNLALCAKICNVNTNKMRGFSAFPLTPNEIGMLWLLTKKRRHPAFAPGLNQAT
jgi:hypothetical protein